MTSFLQLLVIRAALVSIMPYTVYCAPIVHEPILLMVEQGGVARINCTATNDESVFWIVAPCGKIGTEDIYIESELIGKYSTSGRFSVEVNNVTQRHDLIIYNTNQSDAGVYSCLDKRGLGKGFKTALVVTDAKLGNPEELPTQSSSASEDLMAKGSSAKMMAIVTALVLIAVFGAILVIGVWSYKKKWRPICKQTDQQQQNGPEEIHYLTDNNNQQTNGAECLDMIMKK